MSTELVHIGFENIISMNRVVAMLSPTQQPTKRFILEAKNKGLLIDATHARKARTVVVMSTGHVILAAVAAETIARRLGESRSEDGFKTLDDEEEK